MIEFAGLIATALLGCLVIFQLLLIFGKPFGRLAWGGQYDVLPLKLRIASATFAVKLVEFSDN